MPPPPRDNSADTSSAAPAADDQFDRDLVTSIRAGDPDAWGRLIESYQIRIFSICVRMVRDRELASDLTQDAFIKIIKGLDTFDERARLSTWVYRVTVNVCLSKLRSEKLRRHASLGVLADTVETMPGEGPLMILVAMRSREPQAAALRQEEAA